METEVGATVCTPLIHLVHLLLKLKAVQEFKDKVC
jgi:hypothetical protein